VIELAEVVRKELRWLWPGRVPLGKLTLLAGDPELGKSFLTIDMAARVSSGRAWPDAPQTPIPPGNVILLNAEDDIEDTVCPRLVQAGAALDRCTALAAARSTADGLFRPFSLGRDLAALRVVLQEKPDCRLVVIDPVSAYLGKADGNSNTEVRALLYPLAQLASEFQVAVIAVTHLNKKGAGKAIYRAMGSLAFVAAARSAWVVARDPQEPDRHLLLHAKSNLQAKSPGLAYRFAAESRDAVATIAWEADPVTQTLDEVMTGGQLNLAVQEYRNGESFADTWLHEQLTGGPRDRNEFFEFLSRPDNISDPQVYRAAARLGVVKIKHGFSNNRWTWCLPEHTARAYAEIEAEKRREEQADRRREDRRTARKRHTSGGDE
jgi:hypothetical protein